MNARHRDQTPKYPHPTHRCAPGNPCATFIKMRDDHVPQSWLDAHLLGCETAPLPEAR